MILLRERLQRGGCRYAGALASWPALHDIWDLDAKGLITISLRFRKKLTFHSLTVLDDATLTSIAALAMRSSV